MRTIHRALLPTGLILALAGLIPGQLTAQHMNAHDPRALAEDPSRAEGRLAPILDGLGGLHFEVTTSSPLAQRFFDQGLRLTYGFNHSEALRAFKEAARLDPDCAMAYWGWALVLGPNLNLPMRPEVAEQAYRAIQLAVGLRERVSRKERDFIDALAQRYAADPPADRAPLDRAYAEAMAAVHARYPQDDDAATLYAAALMNRMPWDYWNRDGSPKHPATLTVIETLEPVIARNPRHTGALHYYIHIVEAVDPARGERAADLLRGLAPGAGHLVHMPSHIYMRRGRYAEAYEANLRASQADEDYLSQCRAQGIYPLTYYPHNLHFLAWAATLQGRIADALTASRKLAAHVPADMHGDSWALFEPFLSLPISILVRFERWDEILAEPRPPAGRYFWTGVWHWARGLAYARSGRLRPARRELAALEGILADPGAAETFVGFSNARTLLAIGREVLTGEILSRRGRTVQALASLERAVRLEDSLAYNEPPTWFTPSRPYLAEALLRAARPLEAEVVWAQELRSYPDNGFALAGLARALAAQGREEELAAVRERLEKAWEAADADLRPAATARRLASLGPRAVPGPSR